MYCVGSWMGIVLNAYYSVRLYLIAAYAIRLERGVWWVVQRNSRLSLLIKIYFYSFYFSFDSFFFVLPTHLYADSYTERARIFFVVVANYLIYFFFHLPQVAHNMDMT